MTKADEKIKVQNDLCNNSGASAIWCKDPPDLASGVKEAEDLDVQPGPTSDSTDARSVGVSLQQNADAPQQLTTALDIRMLLHRIYC